MEKIPPVEEELQIENPAVLAALYDPLRFRLFRLLQTPRTVAELADEIGEPANRLYYHVRRLLECGLIRQEGARANGRHTERIYAWAAPRVSFAGDLDVRYEGRLLRGIADELEAGLQSASEDDPGLLSYHVVSLTPERARELERRLQGLIAEYEQLAQEPGAERYGVLGVLAPHETGP
jgi:DNA-binding transcriptional ArsR family regulator